jgi:hypothetical protein
MGVWPFGVEAVNRGDQCPTLPRQVRFAVSPLAFPMSGTFGYGRRVAAGPWKGRIEIRSSQRRMRFPDSPLGGPWTCVEMDSGCLDRQIRRSELPDPVQRVLCPRFSVEKNRANSLVRLNANKHYQRFRRRFAIKQPYQPECATPGIPVIPTHLDDFHAGGSLQIGPRRPAIFFWDSSRGPGVIVRPERHQRMFQSEQPANER